MRDGPEIGAGEPEIIPGNYGGVSGRDPSESWIDAKESMRNGQVIDVRGVYRLHCDEEPQSVRASRHRCPPPDVDSAKRLPTEESAKDRPPGA
jgi:hypothetical protein